MHSASWVSPKTLKQDKMQRIGGSLGLCCYVRLAIRNQGFPDNDQPEMKTSRKPAVDSGDRVPPSCQLAPDTY